jgi:hypothetical protein
MSTRKALVSAALVLAATFGASAAHAGDVHWSIGINLPPVGTVIGSAPIYDAPPPVYYGPPQVVYRPAPVYYAPAPVYYPPPRIRYERWDAPRGHWQHRQPQGHRGWERHDDRRDGRGHR